MMLLEIRTKYWGTAGERSRRFGMCLTGICLAALQGPAGLDIAQLVGVWASRIGSSGETNACEVRGTML
jgi:hypothetical protein